MSWNHYYTTNRQEADNAIRNNGYTDETFDRSPMYILKQPVNYLGAGAIAQILQSTSQ
jgi:hypothetical protein